MNKVKIPGFRAQSALYRSTGAYAVTRNNGALGKHAVIPARGIRFCQNLRPGWVIEETVCAECADFVVRCDRRHCWWERVSDWQWECWHEMLERE
jgi:hypothetical protein